jgi:hypothetical protein
MPLRRRTLPGSVTAAVVALAAVAAALVLFAGGAGGGTLGASRSVTTSSSPQRVSPAPGSTLQDMRDLYALKREAAAFGRMSAGTGCR